MSALEISLQVATEVRCDDNDCEATLTVNYRHTYDTIGPEDFGTDPGDLGGTLLDNHTKYVRELTGHNWTEWAYNHRTHHYCPKHRPPTWMWDSSLKQLHAPNPWRD